MRLPNATYGFEAKENRSRGAGEQRAGEIPAAFFMGTIMLFPSRKVARRIWYFLCGLCVVETVGMMTLAPGWDGGTIEGELNGLACFIGGAGVTFFLLGMSEPGTSFSTRLSRYMFALCGGLAADVIVTWGLWAIGYPIINGTIRRGLMAANYWLGPLILAYTVFVWLSYRKALARDSQAA